MSEQENGLQIPPIAGEIARASSIELINLVDFSGQYGDLRANDSIEGLVVTAKVGTHRGPEPLMFSILVGLEVACQAKAEPERIIAKIAANFAAKYKSKDAASYGRVTNEALLAFAQSLGVTHLWPYHREFLQSMAERMLLPRLVLPYSGVAISILNANSIPPAARPT
jgi:hypothetical protein